MVSTGHRYYSNPPLTPLSTQTELGQKLSLCSKLCFAIGGVPKEVAASATAFFLQIYLLDVAQVKPSRTEKSPFSHFARVNHAGGWLFLSAD